MKKTYKVIGGHESYFTGKLEAYLRAKGIPYENIPFTMEKMLEVAALCGGRADRGHPGRPRRAAVQRAGRRARAIQQLGRDSKLVWPDLLKTIG